MPKRTNFDELEKEKKYSFDSILSLYSGGNCIIRAPMGIGKKHPGKKIKVTIEVIE